MSKPNRYGTLDDGSTAPPDTERVVKTHEKPMKVSGIAPCGCRETYDAARRTKVTECELGRPSERCMRKAISER